LPRSGFPFFCSRQFCSWSACERPGTTWRSVWQALAWNLINQFQRVQQAIYPTFEGLFMLVVFVLLFSFLIKKSNPGKFACR
jgi:hypothetical protein